MMLKLFRARLALLVAAIIVVAATTLWGVQQVWNRTNALQRRLTTGHLESFRLAEDFQNRLYNLNNAVLRFVSRREPATWMAFDVASTNLDRWIDQYDPRVNRSSILTTERERQLFQQLNNGYDEYLQAARAVRTNTQPAMISAVAVNQLTDFENQSQHLVQLGLQLADAHREAERAFLLEANRSLDNLREFLFGAVAVSVVLVGLLAYVIYRDMVAPLRTKLVQSEALLERQEKLATLGTLAAGIAHEIRNPLTSVKARLYTLGKHIKGNDAGAADAAVISGEISRLERIVQDVLQFARPSDPRLSVARADILLKEVQSLLAVSLEKDSVQVLFEPGPELYVSMDTGLIKQVVINLVRNAAEAIEGGGTVRMRVRNGNANLDGLSQPVAILEVADTGKGISTEVEKRLFDPFFTTKECGTGLGLSIAARIVEKHGGALQYQTRVGHGTTFGIVLPLVNYPNAVASRT